ncbi:hypothetical protein [Campylobacter majalis]|nr:hypothetical protein [Campylobacter majalis]
MRDKDVTQIVANKLYLLCFMLSHSRSLFYCVYHRLALVATLIL